MRRARSCSDKTRRVGGWRQYAGSAGPEVHVRVNLKAEIGLLLTETEIGGLRQQQAAASGRVAESNMSGSGCGHPVKPKKHWQKEIRSHRRLGRPGLHVLSTRDA